MRIFFVGLFLFTIIVLSIACAQPERILEGVEVDIQKLKDSHASIVVIRETDDYYWAIPVPGIKEAGKTTITVEAGTLIAGGSGKGPVEDIAQALIERRTGSGPYFTTMQGSATVSGQIETTQAVKTFQVKEIVFPNRPSAPSSQ